MSKLIHRRFPRYSELRPLLRFATPSLDRRKARLDKAADIWDLRAIAKRRTPSAPFDYVDGGALAELTADRNRQDFSEIELIPRILHGIAEIDLSTQISGAHSSLPFGIAPTGFTRFMQTEGENAGALAAQNAGIPFSLSTLGTRSIEEVAATAPDVTRWFQLYPWKDPERTSKLLERALAAGVETLLVTVDTPITGQRLRDARNGMKIPPQITLGTVLDASYRPEWWFNFLTTDPLTFASLSSESKDLPSLIDGMFDSTLDLDDLAWIRSQWPGKLFVKGILTREDTRRALDAGADGLVVSNHGGRQLDRAPSAIRSLPEVRDEAGEDVEIILDSGIMSGSDVVAALCLGADFCLIGRAYLYGLMAGGYEGVCRAIDLLAEEIRVTMTLMGVERIEDLNPSRIRQR